MNLAKLRINTRGRWLFVKEGSALNVWQASKAYPNALVLRTAAGLVLAVGNRYSGPLPPIMAARTLKRWLRLRETAPSRNLIDGMESDNAY